MAHLLCVTSGLTGITNASLEFCKRLKKEGNEVKAASIRDRSKIYELNEIEFVKFPNIETNTTPAYPTFYRRFDKFGKLIYALLFYRKRLNQAYKKVYPKAFIEFIRENNFDAIIIDLELHEFIISAFSEGKKVVLLSQWFSIWRTRGLPYILSKTIPGPSNIEKIEKNWDTVSKARRKARWKKRILSFGTDRRTVLLRMARKMGFPNQFIQEDFWPGVFHYDKLPVLSMTLENLDFPHVKRPNLHYIGPMVDENRKEVEKIEGFEDLIKAEKAKGQKIIVGTMSTMDTGNYCFVNKLLSVFTKEESWSLFIGIPISENFKNIKTLKNIFVFPYLPQVKALKYADLSINHGGIHTINECIHYGVPMLIYSGNKSDQNGCAARISYHGIGVSDDMKTATTENISNNIDLLLCIDKFSEQINVYHQKYLDQKEMALTDLIESV